MKKRFSLLLTGMILCLCFSTALAEEETSLTLDGVVIAGETVTIAAPYGGTVGDFTLRTGDAVSAGDSLITVDAAAVYAPCDGEVTGLHAAPGDSVEYINNQYGALLYLMPESPYTIAATTAEAYRDNENRILRPGETVYLLSKYDSDRKGEGFITTVEGEQFGVEVTSGNLDANETVSIHRGDDHSSTSKIGAGLTAQAPLTPVTAEGSVLRVYVQEGELVQRGDLLLEVVSGALAAGQSLDDSAEAAQDGIITAIHVTPGTSVVKDQPLATLCPSDSLEIAVTVSELDLPSLSVGDAVDLVLDGLSGGQVLRGTVDTISYQNTEGPGEAEYTAYVSLDNTDGLRIGMSASVQVKH